MATTALNITEYVDGQNNPDVTINEALNILDALARTLTHNMASDADYTLDTATGDPPFEWQYGTINITDTTSPETLTTGRNIIVPDRQRTYRFVNNTSQTLTLKPSGTGIAVAAGTYAILHFDGSNMVRITADQ